MIQALAPPSASHLPPASFKKEISQINVPLAVDIANWLKKHGKIVHPPLSTRSRCQLKECFELMDADGSGAIDADELSSAFKLLGIQMKRAEVTALLEEVDKDGSGEVDYDEFLQIMTTTLGRHAEEKSGAEGGRDEAIDARMPFSLMATAYRRKRLMEGIVSRDRAVVQQLVRMAEEMEAIKAQSARETRDTSQQIHPSAPLPDDEIDPSLIEQSQRKNAAAWNQAGQNDFEKSPKTSKEGSEGESCIQTL